MADTCLQISWQNAIPFGAVKPDGTLQGLSMDIVKILLKDKGYCWMFSNDYQGMGKRYPNGSFDGKIGQLQNNELDMLAFPMAITEERWHAVDFTVPFLFMYHAVGYAYPKIENDVAGFVKPLSLMTWILLVVSFFTFTGFFVLQIIAQKKIHKNRKQIPIMKTIIGLYKTLVAQPYGELFGNRYLMSLWILLCFVICRVYQSNLNAMITAPRITLPFNNFNEMVNQKDLSYHVVRDSALQSTIRQATPDSRYYKMHQNMGYVLKDAPRSVRRLLKGEIAIVTLDLVLETVVSSSFQTGKKCSASIMKEKFLMQSMGFALPKNHHLKPIVDKIITKLFESGIIAHLSNKYKRYMKYCATVRQGLDENKISALTINNMGGIFLLYIFGIFLAFLAFIGEKIVYRYF